ncbi:hypothetical protein GCM10010300_76970 [Streptomyces olivaceoviridis]|uniref:hypothetical protein n=1 Tax=Streptomyces olivaceoviridis TaxID=1921 RepID=UPI001673670E|nr:hypothetical protein [Streptomyces olivaceoviridis]GGZ21863.1 hypothetical protein GCM10010300_76970 [Streptomyces olivaceoviridis]
MSTTPRQYWTEPDTTDETGCTTAEFAEIEHMVSRSSTTGRESRASRIAVGDWLLAKYGSAAKADSRYQSDAQLDALAARLHKAPYTLRRWRLVAHRWQPQRRPPVFDSPVYVSFSLLYQVAQSSEHGTFDQESFDERVEVLLDLMAGAEKNGVLEVTETAYLRAIRKALKPSRLVPPTAHKALTTTVQQFEARRPEVRSAVLDAVKADEDATRAVAAAYLLHRPKLARAVLREDPDLIQAAASEAAAAQDPTDASPGGETGEHIFRELVQVLGGAKPSDDLLLAEWREDFAKAINRFSAFVTDWYPADAVATRADDDLIKLVDYLAHEVTQWAQTITTVRKPGLRLVGSTIA